MKNSENKIKKQNDSRAFAYKAISLASLSTLALTLGLNNFKEAKALLTRTGTTKFFGSNGSKVMLPGNMGSTGNTGYGIKSAVTGGATKVTGGALTSGSKGFANFNKKCHNPFTQPYLDSVRPSNTSNVGSSNKNTSTKSPTTSGTNGTSKLPTTGSGSTLGSNKTPSIGSSSSSSSSSLSSSLSRNPSTSSSSSTSSSTSSTLSRPSTSGSVGVYENPTDTNNNTNGNKNKLTPKQKAGLVAAGSLGFLGVLAAIGVGVGAAQNSNNNKSDSNGTKGPESVATPKTPENTNKVVNSAAGNYYTDTKA
ncbi:hypothetical protein [Candidatus Arthromitus sp. SFB-rat-Yit]|uniref:hypothetical protein n=1 Tax=Candidatus Arthromitus sp. SFB-rat-Yit TaxID=1041504 RepID=UPI000227A386|nr:hypothetical protein [Candidatus Arthromitus sp. SFB-rat-Yit]BAK81475.1 hypothetical protein RATSFB_0913 [Candidatus Arthromitus sp. SFB-rat-Yit]